MWLLLNGWELTRILLQDLPDAQSYPFTFRGIVIPIVDIDVINARARNNSTVQKRLVDIVAQGCDDVATRIDLQALFGRQPIDENLSRVGMRSFVRDSKEPRRGVNERPHVGQLENVQDLEALHPQAIRIFRAAGEADGVTPRKPVRGLAPLARYHELLINIESLEELLAHLIVEQF